MAQSDLTIQNQSFPSFRADLNDALTALNTFQSGTSRPASAVAGTIWLDTTSATTPTLKYYDGADDISLATLDHASNTVNWLDSTVAFDIINDITPQLGGMLDVNGQAIGNGTEELIKFSETASAVNEITVTNSATGTAPEISATGDDTDIDLKITPKGAGNLILDGFEFPNTDGTAGQVLQTDGYANLSFVTAGGTVAGQVIQVLSDNQTGQISTSSTTYVTTSQSLSITPSSASNKVLVLFDCGVATLAANTGIDIDIRRAGTSIAESFMYTATVSGNLSTMGGTSVLDSPSTTSATTYEVFYRETALAGTVNLYQRRLHLLEVKG